MNIVIARRKKHLLYVQGIGLLAYALLGYILYYFEYLKMDGNLFDLFFLGLIVMHLLLGLRSIILIFKTTPAMVVNDQGVTDNISFVNAGLIKWEDISDCELKKYNGVKYMLITLTENHKPLVFKSRIKEGVAKLTLKNTGAHIAINCDLILYDRQLLMDTILTKLGKPNLDRHLLMN